jgi:hypothetical protein
MFVNGTRFYDLAHGSHNLVVHGRRGYTEEIKEVIWRGDLGLTF